MDYSPRIKFLQEQEAAKKNLVRHDNWQGENPWKKESWNVTMQGKVFEKEGKEVARKMAKEAGIELKAE